MLGLTVKKQQDVTVEIYDVLGRRVKRVMHKGIEPQTTHRIPVNGRELASGLYFLRVRGESFTITRKMQIVH